MGSCLSAGNSTNLRARGIFGLRSHDRLLQPSSCQPRLTGRDPRYLLRKRHRRPLRPNDEPTERRGTRRPICADQIKRTRIQESSTRPDLGGGASRDPACGTEHPASCAAPLATTAPNPASRSTHRGGSRSPFAEDGTHSPDKGSATQGSPSSHGVSPQQSEVWPSSQDAAETIPKSTQKRACSSQ